MFKFNGTTGALLVLPLLNWLLDKIIFFIDEGQMFNRLIRWCVFSVVIATLPIVFNYLIMVTRGAEATIITLTSRGELLLLAAGMTASAVGEIIGSGSNLLKLKIIAGGGCVIILMLAALYFAHVSAELNAGRTIQLSVVSNMSVLMFVFGIISSGSCIAIVELES